MAKRARNPSSLPSPGSSSSSASSSEQAGNFGPREPSEPTFISKTKKHSDPPPEPTATRAMFQCALPPHAETVAFQSSQELELHYLKAHINRCSSCNGNFPTDHYLQLHLEEMHNPLREILQERGEKTYSCLVEGCEKKCSTSQKRRLHCIDKHAFPRTYNFSITRDGIDQHHSMLLENRRRRRVSAVSEQGERVRRRDTNPQGRADPTRNDFTAEEGSPQRSKAVKISASSPQPSHTGHDEAVHELERSLSALQFIPRNLTVKSNDKLSKPTMHE